MVPSLKATLDQVESRIEHDLEAGVRIIQFRPHIVDWLCDLFNGIAGSEITDPDNFNPDRVESSSDDEELADLDLFDDQDRMTAVEKMLPSIKPMYDEIRRSKCVVFVLFLGITC